jgi:hypothetical protein
MKLTRRHLKTFSPRLNDAAERVVNHIFNTIDGTCSFYSYDVEKLMEAALYVLGGHTTITFVEDGRSMYISGFKYNSDSTEETMRYEVVAVLNHLDKNDRTELEETFPFMKVEESKHCLWSVEVDAESVTKFKKRFKVRPA